MNLEAVGSKARFHHIGSRDYQDGAIMHSRVYWGGKQKQGFTLFKVHTHDPDSPFPDSPFKALGPATRIEVLCVGEDQSGQKGYVARWRRNHVEKPLGNETE